MEPRQLVPDRAAVLPFLVLAIPVLWFLFRDRASPAAYLGATAACLLLATLIAAALPDEPSSPALRAAVAPSDGTLLLLGAVVAGGVGFFGLEAWASGVPAWLGEAARPVGVVVGVPLLAALWLSYRLGDWFGEPAMATQFALVGLGLAATAVWLFALATVTSRLAAAAL